MIDPDLKDKEGLPLTCRAVFIIGESSQLNATGQSPAPARPGNQSGIAALTRRPMKAGRES